MMKSKLKIILIILILLISAIIVSGLSVYATYNYLASDISYAKSNGTTVSVENALNDLYILKNCYIDTNWTWYDDANQSTHFYEIGFEPSIVFFKGNNGYYLFCSKSDNHVYWFNGTTSGKNQKFITTSTGFYLGSNNGDMTGLTLYAIK